MKMGFMTINARPMKFIMIGPMKAFQIIHQNNNKDDS